jgi:hypothetical protein
MSTLIGYVLLVAIGVMIMGAVTRPSWALALLMIQYPLEQLIQSYVVYFVQRNELFNLIIGMLGVASLAIKTFSRPGSLSGALNSVSILSFLYYILAAASVLWSPTQNAALDILRPGLSYFIMFVVISPLLVERLELVREFLVVALVVGGITALLVLTNPNGDFVRGRFALRLGGIGLKESNPLAMSDLAAFLVLTAVTLNLVGRGGLLLAVRIGAGLLGTGLLLAASSRGQVVFAGLIALVFYPISVQVRNVGQFLLRAAGLVALVAVIAVGATIFSRQAQGTEKRWDTAEISSASAVRLENMRVLLSEWIRRPQAWPLGLGTGGFAAFEKTSHEPYVHNMIVESLGEFGVVGFLLLSGVLIGTAASAVRLLRMCWDDPDARAVSATLVAYNTFQFLISNKQGNVWVCTQMFTLFLVMVRTERLLSQEGGLPIAELEREDDQYADVADLDDGSARSAHP